MTRTSRAVLAFACLLPLLVSAAPAVADLPGSTLLVSRPTGNAALEPGLGPCA